MKGIRSTYLRPIKHSNSISEGRADLHFASQVGLSLPKFKCKNTHYSNSTLILIFFSYMVKCCTPRSSVLTLLLVYTPNQTIYMKWSTAATSICTDALTEQIQIQNFLLHHQLHALSSPLHFTEPEMWSVLSNPPFSKVCQLNSAGTAILIHLLNTRTTPKSKFQKSDA